MLKYYKSSRILWFFYFMTKLYIAKNYVKMSRNALNFRHICSLKVDWDWFSCWIFQVAMLTMNSPVVSFQLESEEAFTKLLQLVEEALESSKQVKDEKTDTKEGTTDKERANQFKVICLNFCYVELLYSCFFCWLRISIL